MCPERSRVAPNPQRAAGELAELVSEADYSCVALSPLKATLSLGWIEFFGLALVTSPHGLPPEARPAGSGASTPPVATTASRSASALAASPGLVLLGFVCRHRSGRSTSAPCDQRAVRRVRLLAAASGSGRRAGSGLSWERDELSQEGGDRRGGDDGADGEKKGGPSGGWGGFGGGARPHVAAPRIGAVGLPRGSTLTVPHSPRAGATTMPAFAAQRSSHGSPAESSASMACPTPSGGCAAAASGDRRELRRRACRPTAHRPTAWGPTVVAELKSRPPGPEEAMRDGRPSQLSPDRWCAATAADEGGVLTQRYGHADCPVRAAAALLRPRPSTITTGPCHHPQRFPVTFDSPRFGRRVSDSELHTRPCSHGGWASRSLLDYACRG
jgi:hypothetical protein